MKTINIPQEHQNQIESTLAKFLNEFEVWGISQHNEASTPHYVLLLLTPNAEAHPEARLRLALQQISCGSFTVALLIHNPRIREASHNNTQYFLNQIALNGVCLYPANNGTLKVGQQVQRDREHSQRFQLKCEAVANVYLEAAVSITQVDVELAIVALLHEAVYQTTLALIEKEWGYVPIGLPLAVLMDIAQHCSPLPAIHFPNQTQAQKRDNKRIFAPPSMLYYWLNLDAPNTDIENCIAKCQAYTDAVHQRTPSQYQYV